MKQYITALTAIYYPTYWNRWVDILTIHYEKKNIKKQLKWDELEYICDGHWKNFSSREALLLNSKPTEEKIELLAYLKGIDEDTASKYYDKVCECGKKLNPKEIAMFFKFNGVNDNEQCLCKKCMCESLGINEKQYSAQARIYMEEGCSLF